jgi:crotonobetainyl-CoA:carnitine CoA-transferase CaiB-like acyl-CoA transferase
MSSEASASPAALPAASFNAVPSTRAIVEAVWRESGGAPQALQALDIGEREACVLPSSFRVDAAAQATIALSALAAAEFHRRATGVEQTVGVDRRHACAAFVSEQHYAVEGRVTPPLWDPIAGAYPCGDGRWVRIHTNFAHHRDGVLALLGCANDKAAVASALQAWDADAFETEATRRGLVVAMMRSFDQWDAHPQSAALRQQPLFTIERLGDASPLPFPPRSSQRPLQGIRVLDLTRIIAGPVGTRELASHGAQVLTVTAPHLPSIDAAIDTGRGKRATAIDLRTREGCNTLQSLATSTDVFVQGYRPGGLASLGFGAEALAAARPGIVCVSLSAYGPIGPWADQRGFDSLTQTATGFNDAEAQAFGVAVPKPLPCQVLDHGTGYLIAFAATMALQRQREQGGSWHVIVSLARTATWLRSLGSRPEGIRAPGLGPIVAFLETSPSGHGGALRAVKPAARLSRTPAHLGPSVPLGTHSPEW